jgi:AraC-like DNA-binding protein
LLFIIGIQGNRQRNTVEEMTEEIIVPHTADTHSNKTTAELKKKLNDLMVHDKIYLIPDLKIVTLSKMLNTNRTYISNLINDETGCNFNTWVNRYRIDHALEIMNRQGSNLFVTEFIAHESGFGSPSSFIRAFKAHTGITPGKYLQDRALQQTSPDNPK